MADPLFSHISFVSIPVTDQQRARDFYSDVLGMMVSVDAPYGEMRWIMLEIPGSRTQLHLDKVETIPETGKPVLPLIAGDVEGTMETLRQRGVDIVSEPKPAEWDRQTTYALIRDSEGNMILIASR